MEGVLKREAIELQALRWGLIHWAIEIGLGKISPFHHLFFRTLMVQRHTMISFPALAFAGDSNGDTSKNHRGSLGGV